MFIMGTAGHIDHGKTTLIKALTGINPDRLQEEQSRGMTVDLGFAWFSLPNGDIGVVDVPGHHRLVKNMLAGVGLVDFVLLVVAADDGWMPQTQEHVDILHLYGVKRGVVALTKADLVDQDWLDLVMVDIEEQLQVTSLANFPIIPVSATTGENIPRLKEVINTILTQVTRETKGNDPLLWIDRVFTIKGAGTVVTGTLLDGTLDVGAEVKIQPTGLKARVRGLQTHTKTIEQGMPHSRLAVNLTGVEKEELTRGMYLALPESRPSFSLINASVKMLSQAPTPLANNQYVKLYVGTLETLARVRVLDKEALHAGSTGFVQLELEQPAHFSFQDRFILRHSELQDTLGGGTFLEEAIPVRGTQLRFVGPKRHQHLFPFEDPVGFLDVSNLVKKVNASPEELSLLTAAERIYWTNAQFHKLGLPIHPSLIQLGDYIMAPSQLNKLQDYLVKSVAKYHESYPLSPGPSKETLRAETGVPSRLFDYVLTLNKLLKEGKGAVSLRDHRIVLAEQEKEKLRQIEELITQNPYQPPNLDELRDEGYQKELIYAGGHLGQLIGLPGEHWTIPGIINTIIATLHSEDKFQGEFELATFRDHFQTSRKYALAFLEYLDLQSVTIRKGDVRILSKRPQ